MKGDEARQFFRAKPLLIKSLIFELPEKIKDERALNRLIIKHKMSVVMRFNFI